MSDHSNTNDQTVIQQQQEQLAAHRERLATLLAQYAHFGAHVPPYILAGIREAQAALRPIKAWLRAARVPITDEPNDDCPLNIPATLTQIGTVPAFPVPYLFVERQHELERQPVLFDNDETIAVVPAIVGTGGIGKTMLAMVAAILCLEHALDTYKRVLSPDDPDTTTIRENLAALDTPQPPPQADH